MKKTLFENLLKESHTDTKDYYNDLMKAWKKFYPADMFKELQSMVTFKDFEDFFTDQGQDNEKMIGQRKYKWNSGPGFIVDITVTFGYDMKSNTFTSYNTMHILSDKWFTGSVQEIWSGDMTGISSKPVTDEYLIRE